MADDDDKTEEPTPKKIEDAKKEGNVNKSMEVTGAAILFFGSIYLLFFSGYFWLEIKKMMLYIYSFIGQELNSTVYYTISYTVVMTVILALAPLFALVVLLTFVTNWTQFGFVATPLKFDLQKLDPIKGFGNIFGLKKAVESLKLTIKLIIIMSVMVIVMLLTGEDFLRMMNMGLQTALSNMVNLIIYYLGAILLIIIIFAIIDFYFTRFYYMKSLRMSKQDIKDEFKNMDGDPQVKARIRKIQMQMSMKRMMSDVPDADVVITNPTHYAVALKYDNQVDQAPKVIAKGIDFIALRIKDIAKDNDIPIIENPALARSLHDQIEISQEIPGEFYKAIAEIFSYVFELKKNKR
ncbi:flagellar biosynthesis protein FlhB [Malaciobacter molluscorum LMG 25693]|uniref:Flagellar biosynthetic protein FlhB n=1 Tax=Malaciobacter molluscorum LMG 25693 TaxID=870501 RepID=A0A2G1DJ72_9BACT|nr:flagellar biosynthesis protein FlhB [Malaciobacter molluscorum]AXX93126.1 flagellar export apparatus, transmembrane gate complex, FlhB component [Malaciobacter molluscorum LMG 25693]PHO18386.1 flagellar biosynthesis protein FlhB [Malaciobacter molluscorum LMG 25693]RXJ95585.1 flagellar biosynthesis protein FlhB [Malaciobacter molluscorum]